MQKLFREHTGLEVFVKPLVVFVDNWSDFFMQSDEVVLFFCRLKKGEML